MDEPCPEIRFSYAELVQFLKKCQSWHERIALESGVRRHTVRMMANSPDYRPTIDQVELLSVWFAKNGVPQVHIHTARAAERRAR
jgi:hypothetical protein